VVVVTVWVVTDIVGDIYGATGLDTATFVQWPIQRRKKKLTWGRQSIMYSFTIVHRKYISQYTFNI